MKMRLADLIAALAEVKIQLADVQQELLDRDERIRSLSAALEVKKDLVFERPAYYRGSGAE